MRQIGSENPSSVWLTWGEGDEFCIAYEKRKGTDEYVRVPPGHEAIVYDPRSRESIVRSIIDRLLAPEEER